MSLAPCGDEWCDCACYPGRYHCKMGHTFKVLCGKCEVVPDAHCPCRCKLCDGTGKVQVDYGRLAGLLHPCPACA